MSRPLKRQRTNLNRMFRIPNIKDFQRTKVRDIRKTPNNLDSCRVPRGLR